MNKKANDLSNTSNLLQLFSQKIFMLIIKEWRKKQSQNKKKFGTPFKHKFSQVKQDETPLNYKFSELEQFSSL